MMHGWISGCTLLLDLANTKILGVKQILEPPMGVQGRVSLLSASVDCWPASAGPGPPRVPNWSREPLGLMVNHWWTPWSIFYGSTIEYLSFWWLTFEPHMKSTNDIALIPLLVPPGAMTSNQATDPPLPVTMNATQEKLQAPSLDKSAKMINIWHIHTMQIDTNSRIRVLLKSYSKIISYHRPMTVLK